MRSLPADPRFVSLNDDQLVVAAEQGDREAIVEFLRRHWDEFRRVAQSKVRAGGQLTHGVDDILSTTARQVIRLVSHGQFVAQGAAKARGLVVTILRRAIARTFFAHRSERRRLAHRARSAADGPHHPTVSAAPDEPDGALLAHIRSLPEADYRLIVMRLEGTHFDEIAASLGCTPACARKRWHTIRLKLLELMAE